MARTPTRVQIYWDVQDRDNERWAYNASDEQGLIDSGSLESDPDDLDGAITEAICALGLDLTADLFATSKDDGGYAVWYALPSDDDEICIDCGGENIEEGICVDCEAKDCPELDGPIHEEPRRFAFATDSESGYIEAATFEAACEALRTFVPVAAVDNGGWGWVRNENGELFEIGC